MIEPSRKQFVRDTQYRTSDNLDARIELHRRFSPHGGDFWDFVWQRYDFSAVRSLLEVGCGSGSFWLHPTCRPPAETAVTLTDYSRGMLAKAEEKLTGAGIQAEFRVADVDVLPFESFDYAAEMRVTDAELLTEYGRSSVEEDCHPPAGYWEELHGNLSEEIGARGFFWLTKRCVLFMCREPASSV